jgi:ApaG protein
MFHAETHNIRVTVMPVYIDERSSPDDSRYFWAYRVSILNRGRSTVKLVSRYWHIVDGNGHEEIVRGMGVVGEQPVLEPGQSFEYTSGCPLNTPSGFMQGHYVMVDGRGSKLQIEIPAFPLDLPGTSPVLN